MAIPNDPLFPHFPLADCQHHRAAIDAAVKRVLDSGRYILGAEVSAFENEFAAYLGAAHVVGVASGTDAIELMMRALDIGIGDKVVVPSLTATASAAGVRRAGAEVLLADCDAETLTLCPDSLAALLQSSEGSSVKAALVVHLYGQTADWERLQNVANAHGIVLLEDAAQAHGAKWSGRMAGTLGKAAAFSFYPTKNLGALGDAGAVVTNDGGIAERVRALREYGWNRRYISDETGVNSRLDEMQAAILRAKLGSLTAHTARRRELATLYTQRLSAGGVVTPPWAGAKDEHAYHLYVVRAQRRDALMEHLLRAGIPVARHYPAAVHQQPAYSGAAFAPLPLPETTKAIDEILTLPLHPFLTLEAVETVCEAVNALT